MFTLKDNFLRSMMNAGQQYLSVIQITIFKFLNQKDLSLILQM